MAFDPEMIKGIAGAVGSMQQGNGGGGSSADSYRKELEKTDAKLIPLSSSHNVQISVGADRRNRISNFAANFAQVPEHSRLWLDYQQQQEKLNNQ